MPKQTINYALAATLLSTNATLSEIAPQVGAKSADSLRVGLAKRGVTARQARSLDFHPDRIQTAAIRVASQASEALRNQFANILANHANKLAEIPARANLKHLARVGSAMEPLARTAKLVHDWGSEQPNALVVAGLFSEPRAQEALPPAQDIQAVVCDAPNPDRDKTPSSNHS